MNETGETVPEKLGSPWEHVSAVFNRHSEEISRTAFGTEELLLSCDNPERPDYWFAVSMRRYADDSPESCEAMAKECGGLWKPHNGLMAIEVMSLNDRDSIGLQVSERSTERHLSTGGSVRMDKSPVEIIEILERGTPLRIAA